MPSLRNWRKKRVTESNDKKVPALRFKGFTDDWEQRKPNNFLTESKIIGHKGNQAKKLTVKLWGKGIQEKQNTYSGSEKTQYYIRKSGQLMYGKLDFLHAAFGIVPNNLNNYESTIDSPAFDVKNANSSFLLNLFLRKNFYLYYGERANGSRKARRIHEKDFLMMPIKIPSIQEQNQIVFLIKIINKSITLQQRKLEYFMTIKAELLRSIFPNTIGKRGLHISDQPWKLQTMNDIFKEKNIKNEHGKLLSVSISKGIYPFSENERKNNSSNNKSNYKEVKYNDIAYNSMRMWQGALGVSKYDGIVSPAYTVITAKKQENPLFYYYYFKNKRMLFNFRQHSQGLTSDTWNLKFPLFKKIIIQTPISKKEEQIIANLFKTLDQNIIYTKTKIEKFNYIKQFLLQNMFI